MKVVFHGSNAHTFEPGLSAMLSVPHEIVSLPDTIETAEARSVYASADVIIGVRFSDALPVPNARLFQVPGAGIDGIDRDALPETCHLCNCFGHESAIAEYVFAALLARHVPLREADSQLRRGFWHHAAGNAAGLRSELSEQRIGIIGFGHIGKALAARAAAFGMQVHVANRSEVEQDSVAAVYDLSELPDMLSCVDIAVCTLPLHESTRGLIDQRLLACLPPHAIIVNVGRGAVIDEEALYDALLEKRIGGAILDAWYVYPAADQSGVLPATLPFHELQNVVMTPHMSGWTTGTIKRRQQTIVENIHRLSREQTLINHLL